MQPGISRQAPIDRRLRLIAACAALLALAALIAVAVLPGGGAPPANAQAAAQRPNIIFLFTDDQEPSSMRVMKIARKELAEKGTTMDNFYTNFPLCCPSRTTFLTGQYAHNHKVLSNTAPDGGYGVFNELHGLNYLPLWMQAAGYRTSYIGKFLNEYAEPDEYGTLPSDVPSGWDDWHVLAPSRAQYFGYVLNENGKLAQYSEEEADYSTDIFTKKARRFIRKSSGPTPFFLMLGYAAPHGGGGGEPGRSCNRGAVPAPRHLGALKNKNKFSLPPSFNEIDTSDKPQAVQEIPPLTPSQISDITRKRRCAWESLLGVDESIGSIIEQLQKSGEKRTTYIFFTSDNGYLRGEHRIKNNKRFLYEESARVPFIARGPGIPRGETSADVVSNADVVPTFMGLAGATPGLVPDGQSLMPSLQNPELEQGRAILHEAYAGQQILGVRTSQYLYTEWETKLPLVPDVELYDNYNDPYQLNNLAKDPAYAGVVSTLSNELDQLIDCAGVDCYSHPSGQLLVSGIANGPKGCTQGPLTANVTATDEEDVGSVTFRVEGTTLGTDFEPPYSVAVPDQPLRKLLPQAGQVTAKVLYGDGRRVGLVYNVRVCA